MALENELNTAKYERKVIEENNSAKRVEELEAEVLNLRKKASNAKIALSTRQEAYKGIAAALDKQEKAYEKKLKLAVEFKSIMQKLMAESIKMIVDAVQKSSAASQIESQLTPVAIL